ncbi:MAG: NAD(P)H-dependent oxidoreductase [Candidatus Wildermuthbacteria bacterium]|nr:NAD(P)H-dependent oxidoreductase [Candidatus Wildermuthbacteria bacterium]
METIFIPILLGTAREGRQSEKAAKFVLQQAVSYGKFETELLDVRDFVSLAKTERMPENESSRWSKIMTRADGLIIVVPEYNHGYPGELKLMLDQLYKEYNRKPVGVCGVSMGPLGGARMVEALRTSLVELQMVPVRNAVYFSSIQDLFDENGTMKDDSYAKKLLVLFDEVLWYAKALQKARNKPLTSF